MRIRAVIALTRGSERALSRRVDPRGLRFRVFLLRHVVRALDDREGRRLSHGASAVAALVLAGLGVTGANQPPAERHGLAGRAATGVLDLIHAPPSHPGAGRHTPARPSLRGAA
jgi:hypothetical protein